MKALTFSLLTTGYMIASSIFFMVYFPDRFMQLTTINGMILSIPVTVYIARTVRKVLLHFGIDLENHGRARPPPPTLPLPP